MSLFIRTAVEMLPPFALGNPSRLSCCLSVALFGAAALTASAQIVQTDYVSATASIPGGLTLSATDLLQTQLASAARSASGDAAFYREESGYTVDLSRLSDGQFGTYGSSGLGGDGNYTVMPNNVTLTFTFDTSVNTLGYSLSAIRTFASWDDGRDGQSYSVKYATVFAPSTFNTLHTITPYNPSGLDDPANTLVELTPTVGYLAENVSGLQFVFSGFENSGTAYREVDVTGIATPIPEPSIYGVVLCMVALLVRSKSWRRSGA
ncbi:MAG: hypothetical protein JNN07_25355 [Verrucomicrobiales bacterium]|nr:hypothetical protein [Verrucomicrobiales bacterium]